VVLTRGHRDRLIGADHIGDRVEGLISVNNRTARVHRSDETVLQRLAEHAT